MRKVDTLGDDLERATLIMYVSFREQSAINKK